MKNLILFSFLAIASLFISSCSDPCEDVNCGPGTCDDGTCLCPTGFEGTSCEIESRTLYYGTFNVLSTDCPDGISLNTESITISVGSGDASSVNVLHSTDSDDFNIQGTIVGNVLSSSGETDGFNVFTNGTFSADGNTLTGESGVTGFATCDIVFTR